MLTPLLLVIASVVLGFTTVVSSESTTLGPGVAAPGDPYWLQSIKHQGRAAYNPHPSTYKVFRNVKDFGAKGDGVTDDTAAINAAISSGNRCGGGSCGSSTITPALVFFPQGKYLVSSPIIAYYYTQLIGDARIPPTLLSTPGFSGIAVIDADPYIPGGGGAQWYTNQNNFFRSVRNMIIDLRPQPPSNSATGLHWQVSQGTSLRNVVVKMSTKPGNNHQGIFMENGSGGYMGDIVFHGGKYGIWVGNQQFTVRNITVNNAATAIFGAWNWGWTFQGVTINNCQVGFDLGTSPAHQTVGAEAIIDAVVTNTSVFVRSSVASNGKLDGSLVLNNIKLVNVPTAVGVVGGKVVLAGGANVHITSWGQGNVYSGANPTGAFTQGNIPAPVKPSVLLDNSGRIFGKGLPQYADYSVSQFVSVKDQGAKGDGFTDDTAALQSIFYKYSGHKIIFFDAGTYIVTSTLSIPPGTQMIGEAWSVIAGRGRAFQDVNHPHVVVRVGKPGSAGVVEISDIIFTTVGPTAGAIVLEWNVHQSSQGAAGMWDSHIRLGGALGTNLGDNCHESNSVDACYAAFLALHLTAKSTAYLEATWVWLADHDLDGSQQLTIFSGRGILSESAGPVWMIGTAEHHTLYQYSLVNAKNHYMGLIQTESPYYQPTPVPPAPFTLNSKFFDPSFIGTRSAWGLWVQNSQNITVFGAGLYSFFQTFSTQCLSNSSCQKNIFNIDSVSTVYMYSLSTVGTTYQVALNQVGVIKEDRNQNGFASTVTLWSPAVRLDPHDDTLWQQIGEQAEILVEHSDFIGPIQEEGC